VSRRGSWIAPGNIALDEAIDFVLHAIQATFNGAFKAR
jgi:hypothetical protein